MAAVLPININITTAYQDITADILSMDLSVFENFTIYNDSGPRLELIIDGTGVAVIDDTYNGQGIDIESEATETFNYMPSSKYYIRNEVGDGTRIKLNRLGLINIHNADVHSRIINKYMHQHTAIVTTLTAAVNPDGSQYQIEVADATGFAVNDYLHINTTSIETTHPTIIAISNATGPSTFTLDRRLDIGHAIGDEIRKTIVDMSLQVGTLAVPQEYWVGPEPGEVWHLTRFLFEMTHPTSGDLGKYGGIAALTNGTVLRAKISGQYGTFTNWKRNADMKTDMFNIEFDVRSGGQGDFGTSGRGTITESGAVIVLRGDSGDRVEIYNQDDITLLDSFTMKFQGHFEG